MATVSYEKEYLFLVTTSDSARANVVLLNKYFLKLAVR